MVNAGVNGMAVSAAKIAEESRKLLNCASLTLCCCVCGLVPGRLLFLWMMVFVKRSHRILILNFFPAFVFHFLYILCMQTWSFWQKITSQSHKYWFFYYSLIVPRSTLQGGQENVISEFRVLPADGGLSLRYCERQAALRWKGLCSLQWISHTPSVSETASSSLCTR